MINIIPIAAFKDNYIWMLINPVNRYCAIVDPGDTAPVLDYLNEHQLTPCAVLITHHHNDHSGGITTLKSHYPDMIVYGPLHESITGVDYKVNESTIITLPSMGLEFAVYDIPGHTKGHVAYYGNKMLFCGDTLFSAGCGRIFEGTAAEMYHSLTKICSLPDDTLIYCAHEYTAANLRFAEVIEPNNSKIQQRIIDVAKMRAKLIPTLPSLLSLEKQTNPFLRCQNKTVIDSVKEKQGEMQMDPVSIFQVLRAWKDKF